MERKDTFISNELAELLSLQYSHEVRNYMIYTAFKVKSLNMARPGHASYFEKRAKEELAHAAEVANMMHMFGRDIDSISIEKESISVKSEQDMHDVTLSLEIDTTELIYDILSLAEKDENFAVKRMLDSLTKEQVEEEKVSRVACKYCESTTDMLQLDDYIGRIL